MKITCQSCQSKYTVSDDKVQGKTVKIKCRKCGATILVSSNGVTTNGAGAADAGPITAAGTYLVNVSDGDQRSMTLQELVEAYGSGVVTSDTYVWSDGMADWQPLGQVDAISSALKEQGSGGYSSASEPAAPRVAARRDPAKRSQDLFGSGGTQAADDVATSAPLFRSGASPSKPSQREENSTLFSLSALTANAAPTGGGGPNKPTNTEDSGIIDLKALTAAAESRNKAPAVSSSGMGAMMGDEGGLFLAPPVVTAPAPAPVVLEPIEMPQKNRTPLFIGIGALVAAVAIVGAFVAMKGGPETPPVATTESTQAVVAPPPTPTPEAPPVAAAPPPTASASAVAVAPKVGGRPSGGSTKPASGGATAATTKPAGGTTQPAGGAATPPPVKPKGGCNCPPGDLMCAMKCSTK